jgi:hypothetical protein
MRISGIENYIGGADNVKSLSLIQGEQRVLSGQIVNADGTAVDITNFAITAKVDFYLADVTVTSRSMSITNLVQNAAAKTHALAGTKTTPAEGKFTITVPKDFYVTPGNAQIEIDTDLTVNVPLAVMYIDYDTDSSSAASTIRASRMVLVIRRGSPSVGL